MKNEWKWSLMMTLEMSTLNPFAKIAMNHWNEIQPIIKMTISFINTSFGLSNPKHFSIWIFGLILYFIPNFTMMFFVNVQIFFLKK